MEVEDLNFICDDQRHLICMPYSLENLHKMSTFLNIKKCWFNGNHYIIPKKRINEIQSKCKIISTDELLNFIKPLSNYPANKVLYIQGSYVNDIKYIREIDSIKYKDGSVIRKGIFQCFCGKEFICDISNIFKGNTKSCGCTKKEKISISNSKHRLHNSPEYNSWVSMKSRCDNKNNIQFKDYGGRGIIVCERWKDKERGFLNFLEDLGKRPSLDYSIDRVNVNGNYEPSNCRWATQIQQANNKRDNIYLTYNDQIKTITEWARIYNMHRVTLKYRLWRGMNIEKALTTPVDVRFKYKNKKNEPLLSI